MIVPDNDDNIKKLRIPAEKLVVVSDTSVSYSAPVEELSSTGEVIHSLEARTLDLPTLSLMLPGEHLAVDARLAFTVGRLISQDVESLKKGIESYQGSWRRSEVVGETIHGNLVISDYGHHPREIMPTL